MQKCVGVIIPIYNVENFLSKCLESVINQTYNNLQIILVDDGSTDKSHEIAHHYFMQDKRITLISKQNGGQSSARNVGIDYLCNELELDSKASAHHSKSTSRPISRHSEASAEESLINNNIESKIDSNSPTQSQDSYYTLQGIYTYRGCFKGASQEYEAVPFNTPQPIQVLTHSIESKNCEYIHFLDSDDELTLDCIESYMNALIDKQGTKADMVWHDFTRIKENNEKILTENLFSSLNTQETTFLTTQEILEFKFRTHNSLIAIALISMNILSKYRLRFMEYVFAEDQIFAFLVLANVTKVAILPKALYLYRQNTTSTMNFNPNTQKPPLFRIDVFNCFKDSCLASIYDRSYSWLAMANAINDFKNKASLQQDISHYLDRAIRYCTPKRVKALYAIALENKDPKNAKLLFDNLKQIMPKNHFKIRTRIAYCCPTLFKILYYTEKLTNSIRYIFVPKEKRNMFY